MLWHLLDEQLGMRFSALDVSRFRRKDLSRYNVLVFPSAWGGAGAYRERLGASGVERLKSWIEGGGTAIGHPLGASGCRLVGTLARILNVRDARYGCANACCGGGQGVATVIEREEYDW